MYEYSVTKTRDIVMAFGRVHHRSGDRCLELTKSTQDAIMAEIMALEMRQDCAIRPAVNATGLRRFYGMWVRDGDSDLILLDDGSFELIQST